VGGEPLVQRPGEEVFFCSFFRKKKAEADADERETKTRDEEELRRRERFEWNEKMR
jgi:hypothetical protein